MKRSICTWVVLLLSIGCTERRGENKVGISKELYPYYFKTQAEKLDKLNANQKTKRDLKLKELQRNPIYNAIVESKEVSVCYLPSLNALGECIRYTHAEANSFEIRDKTQKELNKAELDFSTNCMTLFYNGGFNEELVEAFDRYKAVFGYYGLAGSFLYDENGKEIGQIKSNYNLTPIFAVLDSGNKELAKSIYEVNSKKICMWENTTTAYLLPYLSNKNEYYNYLKIIDPESLLLKDTKMLEVNFLNVKLIDGKYRFFFNYKNNSSIDFKGEIVITLITQNEERILCESVNGEVKAGGSSYIFFDKNTGTPAVHKGYGVVKFEYQFLSDDKKIAEGNGDIPDSF